MPGKTELKTPNVVIAGSPKCGTTSVFDYLSDHPSICPANVKETYFLIDPGYPLYKKEWPSFHRDGLSGYGNFFAHCTSDQNKVFLEATPDYLYQSTALQVLPALPGVKLVFILRTPSERIWSLYKFAKNNKAVLPSNISFPAFIKIVKRGDGLLTNRPILQNAIVHSQYVKYLLPYKKRCAEVGDARMLVYLFEHLAKEPYPFMLRLCDDIDIDGRYFETYDFTPKSVSYQVRNQRLHEFRSRFAALFPNSSLRRNVFFKGIYYRINTEKSADKTEEDRECLAELDSELRPYNEQLANETGVDLSAWR
jgi:hypothetical protein